MASFCSLLVLETAVSGQNVYFGVWDFQANTIRGNIDSRSVSQNQANIDANSDHYLSDDEKDDESDDEKESRPQPEIVDSPNEKAEHGSPDALTVKVKTTNSLIEKASAENSVDGWFEPPEPPVPNSVEPNRVQEESEINWLLPATPREDSFTSQDGRIESEKIQTGQPIPRNDQRSFQTTLESSNQYSDSPGMRDTTNLNSVNSEIQPLEGSNKFNRVVEMAAFEQPNSNSTTGLTEQPSVASALALVSRYAIPSNATSLPGRPIRLLEMIRQPVAANRRPEMVNQYWITWSAWAEMNSRMEFAKWLDSIPRSYSPSDAGLLNAAKSQADNQVLTASANFRQAQMGLQTYSAAQSQSQSNLDSPSLPLPADSPLIHEYVTNYQLYRQYRSMPAPFQNIDQDLRETLQLIIAHAATVETSQSSADSQLKMLQTGRGNVTSILEAGRTWRAAERELIQSVTNYNRMIANYSLNVTDGSQTPETVVAMLIGREEQTSTPSLNHSNSQVDGLTDRERHSSSIQPEQPRSVVESGQGNFGRLNSNLRHPTEMARGDSRDAITSGDAIPSQGNDALSTSRFDQSSGSTALSFPSNGHDPSANPGNFPFRATQNEQKIDQKKDSLFVPNNNPSDTFNAEQREAKSDPFNRPNSFQPTPRPIDGSSPRAGANTPRTLTPIPNPASEMPAPPISRDLNGYHPLPKLPEDSTGDAGLNFSPINPPENLETSAGILGNR